MDKTEAAAGYPDAREELAQLRADLAAANEERGALRAQVERLREDAERYRWLRRPTTLGVGMVNIWSKGQGRYDAWQGDELDAAIDAARKEA